MSKLVKIALVVSLAFNVAFLVGYFSAPTAAEPAEDPEQAATLVARELELDEAQRETFLALRREAADEAEELHQAIRLAQEELLAETCQPEPDAQKVETLKDQLWELRGALRDLHFRQFRRFMDTLGPRQREAIHERFRSRHKRWRRWRGHLLREFDADGDGELSLEEQRQAIDALRQRVRQRLGLPGPPPDPEGQEGPPRRPWRGPRRGRNFRDRLDDHRGERRPEAENGKGVR